MRLRTLGVGLVLLAVGLCGTARAGENVGPPIVYRWAVGTKLTYMSAPGLEDKPTATWDIYAVAANADGSTRVIARTSPMDGGVVQVEGRTPPKSVYLDIFPDGRIIWNRSIGFYCDPTKLMPLLPPDAKALAWERETYERDSVVRYSRRSSPNANEIRFDGTMALATERAAGASTTVAWRFDREKGCATRIDVYELSGERNKPAELKQVLMLDKIETMPPADAARLAAEYADLRAAHATFYSLLDTIHAAPDRETEIFGQAKAALDAAAAKATFDIVREEYQLKLINGQLYATDTAKEGRDRAKFIGKPAKDFEATDLDGKKYRLSQLRGKMVVILCGRGPWTHRTVPIMKQAYAVAADHNVVFFWTGMVDRVEAAEVARRLGVPFAVLSPSIDQSGFGTSLDPSIVMIAPDGTLQEIFCGYTSGLINEFLSRIEQFVSRVL
jgi:hypothetical protein